MNIRNEEDYLYIDFVDDECLVYDFGCKCNTWEGGDYYKFIKKISNNTLRIIPYNNRTYVIVDYFKFILESEEFKMYCRDHKLKQLKSKLCTHCIS